MPSAMPAASRGHGTWCLTMRVFRSWHGGRLFRRDRLDAVGDQLPVAAGDLDGDDVALLEVFEGGFLFVPRDPGRGRHAELHVIPVLLDDLQGAPAGPHDLGLFDV